MRTSWLSVLAIAASLAACGLAVAAEPMLLKFHQKEGDKAVYSVAGAIQTKMAVGGKAAAKAKVKLQTATEGVQMRCGLDFTKAIGMGRMQVTGRILDGSAKVSSEGKSEAAPLGGLEEQYTVTALGDVKNGEATAGEPVTLPFSHVTLTPDEPLPASPLPNRAIKVGDMWSGTEGRPLFEAGEGQMRYTSKIVGEETYAGRHCLRIKTETRASAQGDVPISGLANRVPLKATLTATETWLFDPADGIVLTRDTTARISGTATIEGAAASMTQIGTLESHVKLVEWNGQPVEAK